MNNLRMKRTKLRERERVILRKRIKGDEQLKNEEN
jgi:hypothetical protein